MIIDHLRRGSSGAAIALLLTACTGNGAPAEDSQIADGTDVEADGGGPDDGGADETGTAGSEGSSPAEQTPSGRLQLTGFRDVAAGGLVAMSLTAVEVDAAGNILLDIDVVHQGNSETEVVGAENVVVDDLGNVYRLIPPEENEDLALDGDERMTGTLAFEGPVDPGAQRFLVATGQSFDAEPGSYVGGETGGAGRLPFLLEDVPFPGVGLEDQARNPEAPSQVEVEVGTTTASEDNPDVEVTVLRYRVEGQTVEIDIEAVNRSDGRVRVANRGANLADDTGAEFIFVDPEDVSEEEAELELEPGDEASATLAFRGAPTDEATELQLSTNTIGSTATSPEFQITIPLEEGAGSGAAGSGGRGSDEAGEDD